MDDAFCDDSRTEFRAAMDAVLGPNTKLFVIIARKGFALRHGPLKLAEVDELVEWAKREHVDLMVTADCGPIVDRERAAALFGDTREERAKRLSDRHALAQDLNACMLTTSEVLQSFIERQTGTATRDKIDLARRLQITRGPVEAIAREMAAAKSEATQPAEGPHARVIETLLNERNHAMNSFGQSSWLDGRTVTRIAEIDGQLRAYGYAGDLAPVHDETADNGELCKAHPAPPAAVETSDGALGRALVANLRAQLNDIAAELPNGTAPLPERARLLMDLLNSAMARADRVELAVYWALGQDGDFEPKGYVPHHKYWWREELRKRAFAIGGDVKSPIAELRDAGLAFWNEAVRAIPDSRGHEGSELLEVICRFRHALVAAGVPEHQIGAR